MDMNNVKKEEEERFALIVTDAFSRYAYIRPMKNKNNEDVLKASKATFKDVLKALKATFKVMGEPIEIFMRIQHFYQ